MSALDLAFQAVRLYAETHPRPSQVTQAQAAEMMHLSRATVSRMVRSGLLPLNKCGLIPITEIDLALQSRRPAMSDAEGL
jgi:DNA-binding transcriptional regulator LsrR (DeoR family)